VLGALLIVACSDDAAPTAAVVPGTQASATTASVANLVVSPATVTLTVGDSIGISTTARDRRGRIIQSPSLTWTSSAPAIASVSATGMISGKSPGRATVTVRSGRRSASVAVTIAALAVPGTVSNLIVSGRSTTSLTVTFTAATDGAGGGSQYALRIATPTLTWSAAANVTSGSCALPIATVAVGALQSCTVAGLAPGTSYQIQLVAYRGTWSSAPVLGALSNLASGATLTVTPPPGGGATPWFVEDFSRYTSTSDLTTLGAGRPFTYFFAEDGGCYTLDNSGVNVDGLNLTKSLRVNFPGSATWTDDSRVVNGTADRCDNYTMRPVLRPNGAAFGTQRHLWFEFYIRFSSNWTTLPPTSWGCSGANDHKTWIMEPQGGGGRWEIKVGFGAGGLGPAVTVGDPVFGQTQFPNVKSWLKNDPEAVAPTYWNNQWQRVRVEVFLGSTPGATDGVFRVWMNNTQIHNRTGMTYNAASTGFQSMQMGANRNHGQGEAMHFSWGLIRIYNTNPGW
jgi:hypothetical protein